MLDPGRRLQWLSVNLFLGLINFEIASSGFTNNFSRGMVLFLQNEDLTHHQHSFCLGVKLWCSMFIADTPSWPSLTQLFSAGKISFNIIDFIGLEHIRSLTFVDPKYIEVAGPRTEMRGWSESVYARKWINSMSGRQLCATFATSRQVWRAAMSPERPFWVLVNLQRAVVRCLQ